MENDPRPRHYHDHDAWEDDSDPEEADIDEHFPHHATYMETPRSPHRNDRARQAPPMGGNGAHDDVFRNFHDMLGNFMGPNLRAAQTGRSGPETLFGGPGWTGRTFRFGGNGNGPTVTGGSFTFTGRVGGAPRAAGQVPARDPFE